jgi:hypothetical protein
MPYKILRTKGRITAQGFNPGGLFFVCHCGHKIDVNSFPQVEGVGMSRRTQAAAAMKKHQQTHTTDPTKGTR